MLDVLYHGCPYDLSGYGAVARNHLVGLYGENSINVRLRTKKFWTGPNLLLGEVGSILKKMEVKGIKNKGFIFFQHLTPENFFIDPRASYHVCYTPFETDGAPIGWLLGLKAMDEIWVPSEENKKSYTKMGLPGEKIKVVPHGVNTERYNPDIAPLNYERAGFNFGSVFDWTERKNPKALIRSYYNAFKSSEDVSLTLRVFWRFPFENTMNHVKGAIQQIKDSYSGRKDFPKIILWTEMLSEDAIPNLYKSFDCFVLPSRGEGFGLPLIEAMACGVPTVGSSWGGNTDFMTSDNSFLVGGTLQDINDVDFLRKQPQYAGQKWFDIDEEQLGKTFRWIFDNRGKAKEIGSIASKEILKDWTWDHTVKKIVKNFEDISSKVESTFVFKKDKLAEEMEIL